MRTGIKQLNRLYSQAHSMLPNNLCAIALEETDRFGFQESMSGREPGQDFDSVTELSAMLQAAVEGDSEFFAAY